MNWSQLKDFCNSLPMSELENNVILWREDEAITDIGAEQLQEDYYIKKDEPEDGCFSCSDCDNFEPDIKIERIYQKGHPILHENF